MGKIFNGSFFFPLPLFKVVNRRGHDVAADWWSFGVLMVPAIIIKNSD